MRRYRVSGTINYPNREEDLEFPGDKTQTDVHDLLRRFFKYEFNATSLCLYLVKVEK